MMLADTSVWIDHFRRSNAYLAQSLAAGEIVCHSFVVGELATGMMRNRTEIIGLMRNLMQLPVAGEDEFLWMIETHGLFDKGIGFVDVHLLVACLKSGVPLWTLDKRLKHVAESMGVAYPAAE